MSSLSGSTTPVPSVEKAKGETAPAAAPPPPMSTTKALQLSIAIPRVYRIYLPPSEQEDMVTAAATTTTTTTAVTSNGNPAAAPMPPSLEAISTVASTSNNSVLVEPMRERANTLESVGGGKPSSEDGNDPVIVNIESTRINSETLTEKNIGYVENEKEEVDKTGNIVEHVVTAEEMATVVRLDAANTTASADSKEDGDAFASEKDSERTTISTAIKSFFGVVNKNAEQVPTGYLDREGAIAAIKEYDPIEDELAPNTEIKVEELVRICFRNLYNEGHFYNAPIYTAIISRVLDGEQDDWVEVAVMVKDPSIGTILERLERIGVGSSVGTISIFKAELCRSVGIVSPLDTAENEVAKAANQSEVNRAGADRAEKISASLEAARTEWKNAASRLRVEQVKEQIQEQAALSLDYLALLFIASMLAAIGLITNSVVVIVASMLVSPIMGPVMGMTFGTRVLDWKLAKISFLHECISLLGCVVVGILVGLASSWSASANDWPTEEMESRGDVVGLITGMAIAIPSGMGVALSILGNNTASLVGVAISASLLPPAVNTGVCWAHGFLIMVKAIDNGNDANFLRIGAISFILTVVNIACIWVAGMLMFTVKEVAPSQSKSAFWARDIKVARAIQKGSKEVDMEIIKAGLHDALTKQGKGKRDPDTPKWRKRLRRRGRSTNNLQLNMAASPDIDDIVDWEDIVGPTPLIDDVQYVGLEDMAGLLGFHDDDDYEEPAGPTRRNPFRRRPTEDP